jgi:hypothetical protein
MPRIDAQPEVSLNRLIKFGGRRLARQIQTLSGAVTLSMVNQFNRSFLPF